MNRQDTLIALLAHGPDAADPDRFDGVRLSDPVPGGRRPFAECLAISLALARALYELHRDGRAHLGLSADTVRWDAASGTLHLAPARANANASANASASVNTHALLNAAANVNVNPNGLATDPECMAPETTGRLDLPVDERADLYALGALMYRLFAGRPVFEATDPLGWRHAHLAQVPQELHTLDPAIPPVVSDLVARLLAKLPQQRYQSAWGVQADLARCVEAIERTGTVAPMTLGRDDISPRILEPRQMVGREAPLRRMNAAIAQVRRGATQTVMLRGPAGSGKSALVRALRTLAAGSTVQFASGKVDQFQRHIPYAALSQALSALVAQRAVGQRENGSTGDERVDAATVDDRGSGSTVDKPDAGSAIDEPVDWAAVAGDNLPFLQVLVPALVVLGGRAAEPLPTGLSPTEIQARFAKAGAAFIRRHARADAPLVLFIDDLQWADLATLELLQQLLSDRELDHLLLIGAYRDDEVDINHPLTQLLARLRESDRPLVDLPLAPLGEDDLVVWLTDSLHDTPERVAPLATILAAKTLGNPFFVQRFLEFAHQQGLLQFDRARREWVWHADALRDSAVMDDVVRLLLSQLDVLAPDDRRALADCAVVGARFELANVAYLTGRGEAALTAMIGRACRAGFVQADGAHAFAFVHDRVQEATSLTLDAGARRLLHARLGQQLRARLGESDRDPALFDAVRHLTHAVDAASPRPERTDLMHLALRAARQARLSGAPAEGLRFAQTAVACADEALWHDDPATACELHVEAQRLAFLCADHALADTYFAALQAHPGDPTQRVESHVAMLMQLAMRGQYQQAVTLGLEALAALGFTLDLGDVFTDMATELAIYDANVARIGYEGLLNAPNRPDARIEAIVRLARATLPAAFFANPIVCPLLGMRLANLCMDSGMTRCTGYTFSMACVAYIAMRGDYRSGAAAADYSLRAAIRDNDPEGVAETSHILGLVATHWVAPLDQTIGHARTAFRLLRENGNLQLAGYTFFDTITARLERGEALALVGQEIEAAFAFTGKTGNFHAEQSFDSFRQLLRALRGETLGPQRFDDAAGFSEAVYLAGLGANEMARCHFHIHKLLLASYTGDEAGALAHARAAAGLVPFITGFLAVGSFNFHAALAACDALRSGRADDPAALQASLQTSIALLVQWAGSAPSTFAHKLALVRAEQAALAGEHWAALQHFEHAIAQARANGAVHEEGLAAQRAARWCDASGLTHQARGLRQTAQDCFARWGARVLLTDALDTAGTGAAPAGHDLDLDSVLKSAEAIGGELAYAGLVKKLVTVALENAGAQRAVLLCQGPDGRQAPEAWVETTPRGLAVVGAGDGAAPPAVPALLLRTVLNERVPLLIDDAASDTRSLADAVVLQRGIKSVLVLPLLRQQALIGVLYLENNLAAGLFTEPRVRVLRVIAGQAAVALESARLFGDLERQVALRTRELELRNLDLAREVREREAAELELHATQGELAEAAKMAALGGLVAGVAHEINTPIGLSLTAASHFRHMVGELDKKFRAGELDEPAFESFVTDSGELARAISVSLEKAAALVRSFKLVAVDQGSDDLRSFPARAYLDDVVLTHQPVLRRAHAALELVCEPTLMVESFPGAWSQILSNLIGNSVAHGFDASIADPRIHVQVDDGPDAVLLTYRDNGRGMSAEVAKKVFDPFFTTNRQGGGSGLGMHIVYNIVSQQLRGRIQLETAPGEGVTFTIRLPKQRPAAVDTRAVALTERAP